VRPPFHGPSVCAGRACPFHNPSNHRMRDWPINLRETGLTERLCPHGIGHPDPDSRRWLVDLTGDTHWGTHGCDGCCTNGLRLAAV
jgi:hypothetical protein